MLLQKKIHPKVWTEQKHPAAVPRCMQCTISRQNPLSTAFGKLRSINTHFVTQLLLWSLYNILEESIFILLLYILLRQTVPETIDSVPMCITDLFQNKSFAYLSPK